MPGTRSGIGSDFDPQGAETFTSAHEEFARLRAECPVAHSEAWDGFWAVLRHEDVVDILTKPSQFVTSVQNVVPKVAFTGRRPPLHLDPPEHTPYRQVINQFFTPDQTQRLEPVVRDIAQALLGPFVEAGGGDICDEFTHRFPGFVFERFFHLPEDLGREIREVTSVYNRAVQEARDELVVSTSKELYDIARRMIEMRRAEPLANDLTTALLEKRWEGEPLPDDLVVGTIRQMIVVGMIAPSVFIGTMFVHLAEHPELQDRLRSDPDLIPAAVEEYLRLFTPYRGFARTSTSDVTIGGREIERDEPIALVYASANRDESVFPNGDEFILNRPNINQHVAFGRGPHRCAGAPLARVMLSVTLESLLAMTTAIQLDGDIEMTRWPEWGTLRVPLRVEPRT